jgi:hypothetical protein
MLTAWARNVGIAPTHTEKRELSHEYVFYLSLRKVCSSAAADFNRTTQHVCYWLLRYPRTHLEIKEM